MVWVIIIGIIFLNYIKKTDKIIDALKKENIKLKKELALYKNQELNNTNGNINRVTESGIVKDNNIVSKPINTQVVNNQTNVERKVTNNVIGNDVSRGKIPNQKVEKRKELDEKDSRNIGILITGAILIVLAAIVFLMSTWSSIPNLLKTGIIILLVGVFLGASKIAKEKFKLEKASATFFYIAMAYIPICLLSCSIFSLFGEYFSIYGEGNYIYLSGIMILTSAVYYINYKIKNSKALIYASFISQISAVVLATLIFENSIKSILVNILIYNIALMIVIRNKSIEKIEFVRYLIQGIAYMSGIIIITGIFPYSDIMKTSIILVLLTINYLLLYLKNENTEVNAYLFNIALYSFGAYIIFANQNKIDYNFRILFEVIYIAAIFVLNNLIFSKKNLIKKSSMVISIINMTLIYLTSINYFDSNKSEMFIKPFMVGVIEEVLLFIAFMNSKELGKKITGFLIPIIFTTIGVNLCYIIKADYYLYVSFAILTFILGELIRNKDFELLHRGFFIISHLFLILVYINMTFEYFDVFLDDVLFFMILVGIYCYSFIKNPSLRLFKYLAYVSSNLTLCIALNFLKINLNTALVIPALTVILVTLLESKYENLKDSFSSIFVVCWSIVSYILLNCIEVPMNKTILSLLFSMYLYYNNIKNNEVSYLRIIPLLGALPTVFYNELDESSNIIIQFLVIIALSGYSIYKKEISIDTIFSGIYLFLTIEDFDSYYLKYIIGLVWAVSHAMFMEKDKQKDIFKGISYFLGLCLYNSIIEELKLDKYNAFYMIGIMVAMVSYLRTILNKYMDKSSLDSLEYIAFILFYLVSLASYNDEKDGMIFVLAVVCLVIFSYAKKYGNIFIVSTIAIMVNAIALTREFWFSIPWWLYLLVIGSILIAFAIKNESNNNKEKISVGKIIQKVKDNVEK